MEIAWENHFVCSTNAVSNPFLIEYFGQKADLKSQMRKS